MSRTSPRPSAKRNTLYKDSGNKPINGIRILFASGNDAMNYIGIDLAKRTFTATGLRTPKELFFFGKTLPVSDIDDRLCIFLFAVKGL